jgi:hypothetical protein
MGEWRYSSTIIDLGTKWSDQIYVPGQSPSVPIGQEAAWAPGAVLGAME